MKIMFFSPHAAIWQHAFPEALIAEALKQEGNEILYVTCSGQLEDYCICMSAHGLFQNSSKQEKQNVCYVCNKNKDLIKKEFGFKGYELGAVLMQEDRKKINEILASVNQNNYLELAIDSINIGRIALYDFILQFKKKSLDFSEVEWSAYLIALKNSLVSFFACRCILERERPERVITYNSAYSVNRICCQLARERAIPTYFLHAGLNLSNILQTMIVARDFTPNYFAGLKVLWPAYKNKPCSEDMLKTVTDHFKELFKGKHFWVYSSSRKGGEINIRRFFGIAREQKVLVATMSSYDERMAAEKSGLIAEDYKLIFPEQVDWIKALIQFVEKREDLFLIIRVHPREFPNKREGVKSQHSRILEQELRKIPPNVRVNWPTDNISLYDLAEETDVFLNAWSSVGEEMGLFGLPVVIYSAELVGYAPDLNYVATSEKDFFEKIDQALKDGWSFERIRMAYRWYVLKFDRSVFNIAESFSPQIDRSGWKYSLRMLFDKVYWRVLSVFSSTHRSHRDVRQQFKDCRDRAKSLKAGGTINSLIKEGKNNILELSLTTGDKIVTLEQETEYIKKEIRRLGVASVISKLSNG